MTSSNLVMFSEGDSRDRRQVGEDLMQDIIIFASQWQSMQPEDARNFFQDWTDQLSSADLTDRELRALRRLVRKLSNECSDRSGVYGDNVPMQALPGLIFSVSGLAGFTIGKLPVALLFALIVFGFSLAVARALLASKQRRWRIPVDAMNKYEAEISKKIESPQANHHTRYRTERHFVRRLDSLALHGSGRDAELVDAPDPPLSAAKLRIEPTLPAETKSVDDHDEVDDDLDPPSARSGKKGGQR